MGFPHDIEQLITRSKLMNNELFIRKKCFEVLKKKKATSLDIYVWCDEAKRNG